MPTTPHAFPHRFTQYIGLEHTVETYKRLQVSRKGVYSVEAIKAFQEYSAKPWTSSIALILLVPVPAIVCIIGLECIPLVSPTAGWKANYMFFIRSSGFQFICTLACWIQLLQAHSEVFIPMRILIFSSSVTVVVQTGLMMLFGYIWTFPIPYSLLILLTLGVLAIGLSILVVFDTDHLTNSNVYQTVGLTIKLLLAQATLIVVYPAFSAVFVRLQGLEQAAFVLVLPVIKVFMKNLMANLLLSMPEDIIHTTVFSVELFNAFYVSTCMQTAVNSWSTVVLIVYDALNSAWSLYSIQRASQNVCLLQSRLDRYHREDLVTMVLRYITDRSQSSVFGVNQTLKKAAQDQKKIRVAPDPANKTKTLSSTHKLSSSSREKQASVIPFSPTTKQLTDQKDQSIPTSDGRKPGSTGQVNVSNEDKVLLLQQTQSLLFRCEYLASLEYVEFVVPFIYIIYMLVLYNLPNAKYHANFRYLTEETLASSMKSIALYGSLELLSFITFVSYIRWKFGFSPMKLLGFSFQAQATIVVARCALFLVFVAQFPYPHYGMDPTFQFDYSNYP